MATTIDLRAKLGPMDATAVVLGAERPRTSSLPDSRIVSVLLLLAATACVLTPFWPGLITYDANSTLFEAEQGPVRDWWSPFVSILWRAMLVVGDTWLVFVVQTVLVVVGVHLCARLVVRRVPAAAVTLLICVYPPLYAQLSGPSRDGYYLGFTMLALGFLCCAVRDRRRALCTWLSIAAIVAASLCRQNAIVAVFVLVTFFAVLACRDPGWRPRRWCTSTRRWPVLVGVVAGVVVAIGVVGATRVAYSVGDVVRTRPERLTFIYDLAAMSVASGEDLFPDRLDDDPHGVVPRDISLATLERTFRYSNVVSLYPGGNWNVGDLHDERLSARESSVLRDAWWAAISAEPDEYAHSRARLTLAQLGFGDRPQDAYLGLVESTNFGHPLSLSGAYDAASRYVRVFVGSDSTLPLDVVWVYFVGATALVALRLRSREPDALPAGVMGATMWSSLATLTVSAMAVSFRYVLLSVAVFLVVAVFVVAGRLRSTRTLFSLVDPFPPEDAPTGEDDAMVTPSRGDVVGSPSETSASLPA
jgi:hypothetical protein